MYHDLREFLTALDRHGELARVTGPVSPVLEISGIADRMSRQRAPGAPSDSTRRTDPNFWHLGGKALVFTHVEGSEFPVVINAFGSYRRVEMALGCSPGAAPGHGPAPNGLEALAARIGDLVKPEFPRTIGEGLAKVRQLLPLLRIPPKRRRGLGICQEVVLTGEQIDLRRLPMLRCWPLDGDLGSVGYPADVNDRVPGVESGPEWEDRYRGRYVTLGGVHTIHASDAGNPRPPSHNIGMYRLQLMGRRHLAMHCHMHHDGARHWRSWKARGERMPVAIALGGESVLPYAATAPLPPGLSELLLAGFLNGRGIEMVMGRTVPIWVPANSEIVIEGYVSAEAGGVGWEPGNYKSEQKTANSEQQDRKAEPLGPGGVFEGPFGDHTGFYSMPDRYPLMEVTAITHRRGAIYPTTIVGLPPQEDYFLGKATERLFLPLLRTLIPDIDDYDLPMFGAFHNCAAIRIRKEYPMQARRVMHSVWGAGQMAWTKTIFVVDADVDVHDAAAVLKRAAERCVPGRDTEKASGPLDILDHAAPRLGAGMKIGFDCTRKVPGDGGEHPDAGPGLPDAAQAARLVERLRAVEGIAGAELPGSCGHGWLLVKIRKTAAGQGRAACRRVLAELAAGPASQPAAGPRFVVVLGEAVEITDINDAMFHFCANCDVSRDLVEPAAGSAVVAFDATPKLPGDEYNGRPVRVWPPIIRVNTQIAERIEARWAEYGLA